MGFDEGCQGGATAVAAWMLERKPEYGPRPGRCLECAKERVLGYTADERRS